MKSNLYTRTGDTGTKSLIDGSRVEKSCLRLEAYGTLDELSSHIGLVAAQKDCMEEVRGQLQAIQTFLFEAGAYLATPVKSGETPAMKGCGEETLRLEGWIDTLDEQTPQLRSFILPGGGETSAHCHVARTVCRRAERILHSLSKSEYVDGELICYINRLSDYLFIASRYLNFMHGIDEVVWTPKK